MSDILISVQDMTKHNKRINTAMTKTAMTKPSKVSEEYSRWRQTRMSPQVILGLSIFSRFSAAAVCGYLAAATLASLLTLLLPLSRFESTLTANMLSFLFYAIAIIYAFCVRKTWHAWCNLGAVSALCYGLIWMLG